MIIDLPQVVNAAGNNAALAMVASVTSTTCGPRGFAPELLGTEFARNVGRDEQVNRAQVTGRGR